jgi:hypothetical protein
MTAILMLSGPLAAKHNVLPIDWQSLERTSDIPMGRPIRQLAEIAFEYLGRLTNRCFEGREFS